LQAQTTTRGFLAFSAGALEIAIVIQGAYRSVLTLTFTFFKTLREIIRKRVTERSRINANTSREFMLVCGLTLYRSLSLSLSDVDAYNRKIMLLCERAF